jgi:hypothetical protein
MEALSEDAAPNKLAAALDLAARGLRVFPIMPGTKRPYRHTRGFLDATDDAATIVALWTATPDAEIGLACAPSGVVVFDIDPRHGGERDDLGDIPDTWEVETPGGGGHVYFGCADDRLQVADTLSAGIDIKWHGYVLAPPSLHPNGGRYCWVIGHSPADLPVASLPPELAARAADRLRVGCDRLARDGAVLTLTEGTRNVGLFKFACLLRRYGLEVPALTAALLAINTHHAKPALPETTVRATAAAVCRRYQPTALR